MIAIFKRTIFCEFWKFWQSVCWVVLSFEDSLAVPGNELWIPLSVAWVPIRNYGYYNWIYLINAYVTLNQTKITSKDTTPIKYDKFFPFI